MSKKSNRYKRRAELLQDRLLAKSIKIIGLVNREPVMVLREEGLAERERAMRAAQDDLIRRERTLKSKEDDLARRERNAALSIQTRDDYLGRNVVASIQVALSKFELEFHRHAGDWNYNVDQFCHYLGRQAGERVAQALKAHITNEPPKIQ